MELHERLSGVVDILIDSNNELQSPKADETGFIPVPPEMLAQSVMALLEHTDTTHTSLDLGCGNGGWMLLAAAAGFPSYGIDINPFLIDHCQRNYERAIAAGFIDAATPCAFITGDMIPLEFSARYDAFRKLHTETANSMPIAAVVENAYDRLPVSVATADILYCWSWPTQSRFVFNMLDAAAKKDAIFVLPSYARYTQGAHVNAATEVVNTLFLAPMAIVRETTIGRRKPLS